MEHKEVSVITSRGIGKYGVRYVYIRPSLDCFNRSRRCPLDKVGVTIEKYFTPMNYYTVNGRIIGSNTPENALKEYHRVCAIADIKKQFEVTPISQSHVSQTAL